MADEAGGVIDLGTFTRGWHDEWHWTPEYWKERGLDPAFGSNTPTFGVGNSGYRDYSSFTNTLNAVIVALLARTEPSEVSDTEAFVQETPFGVRIIEVQAVEDEYATLLEEVAKLVNQGLDDNEIMKLMPAANLAMIARFR